MTLTLSNSNASTSLTGSFTDTLANMTAVGGSVGGTCTGTTPSTLTPAATSLSFSGIIIPASSSCTVTFSVTSSVAGTNPNSTSAVTTTQATATAGTGSNTPSLTVVAPPTISESFSPSPIPVNSTTTLTFTIMNPNTATTLTGVSFSDMLGNRPLGDLSFRNRVRRRNADHHVSHLYNLYRRQHRRAWLLHHHYNGDRRYDRSLLESKRRCQLHQRRHGQHPHRGHADRAGPPDIYQSVQPVNDFSEPDVNHDVHDLESERHIRRQESRSPTRSPQD